MLKSVDKSFIVLQTLFFRLEKLLPNRHISATNREKKSQNMICHQLCVEMVPTLFLLKYDCHPLIKNLDRQACSSSNTQFCLVFEEEPNPRSLVLFQKDFDGKLSFLWFYLRPFHHQENICVPRNQTNNKKIGMILICP